MISTGVLKLLKTPTASTRTSVEEKWSLSGKGKHFKVTYRIKSSKRTEKEKKTILRREKTHFMSVRE